MKHYTLQAIDSLINQYIRVWWSSDVIQEWVLWYWVLVLSAEWFDFAVVKEVYVSEWSSTHTVRFYKKLPKKFLV